VLAVERRLKVLERVAEDQAIEVSTLARDFQVSEMTIRRDLRRLERDGFVRRTYGGATTHLVRTFEVGANARTLHHAREKRIIAKRAAELTVGVRAMFLGIGTTVEHFARLLPAREDLMVVTPSLAVASLLGTRNVRVIIAGGLVRQDELTCIGASAVEAVRRYNTDTAVIGAAGLSARRGITELDDRDADVIRGGLERTERIIVIADGSKFGAVAMSTVASIEQISTIVTDGSADPEEIRRIEQAGIEVVVAAGEACCGSLVHHMGREEQALAQARNNIDAWTREVDGQGLDAILITVSGCGTTVKDYGFMLRSDPAYAVKAARISALAKDVTEYLATIELQAGGGPMRLTVAYHSACSLQHGQQVTHEPKDLLLKFGFVVKDVPDGHLCCGSAGTYNILQPALAERLRDRKVANIERLQPDVIAAGNIGCITQIAAGTAIPVVHTVELIDWATGGPVPEGLEEIGANAAPERLAEAAR